MQELFLCNPTNYTIEVGAARGRKSETTPGATGVQCGLRHEVSGGGVLPPCLRQASGLIRRASGLLFCASLFEGMRTTPWRCQSAPPEHLPGRLWPSTVGRCGANRSGNAGSRRRRGRHPCLPSRPPWLCLRSSPLTLPLCLSFLAFLIPRSAGSRSAPCGAKRPPPPPNKGVLAHSRPCYDRVLRSFGPLRGHAPCRGGQEGL